MNYGGETGAPLQDKAGIGEPGYNISDHVRIKRARRGGHPETATERRRYSH